jgi:hypothetical protein
MALETVDVGVGKFYKYGRLLVSSFDVIFVSGEDRDESTSYFFLFYFVAFFRECLGLLLKGVCE